MGGKLMTQQEIISLLCKIAEEVQPVAGAKMAAALEYNGQIMSVCVNKRKSDPWMKKYGGNEDKIYLHAEIGAIKKYCGVKWNTVWKLYGGMDLYVVRVKRPISGSKLWVPAMARPCRICLACAREVGVRRICYTTGDWCRAMEWIEVGER